MELMYGIENNSNKFLQWDPAKDEEIFGNADKTLIERFREYHEQNPGIYWMFFEKALIVLNSGRARYSAWIIFNVIRWELNINTVGDDFKVNNDFIALYTRLLIFHHPIFKDFFELRGMKSHRVQMSSEQRKRVLAGTVAK